MKDVDKFLIKQEKRIAKLKKRYNKTEEPKKPEKPEEAKKVKKSKKQLIAVCSIFVFFISISLYYSSLGYNLDSFWETLTNIFNLDIWDGDETNPINYVQ